MKYLITQSQLDKIIFKYLDNQDLIQIDKKWVVYFVNSEGDDYANSLIRYYKGGECIIRFELIDEIKTFFSMEFNESKYVIARWVADTLGVRVTDVIIM